MLREVDDADRRSHVKVQPRPARDHPRGTVRYSTLTNTHGSVIRQLRYTFSEAVRFEEAIAGNWCVLDRSGRRISMETNGNGQLMDFGARATAHMVS